jgi:spore coat protein U-like protein
MKRSFGAALALFAMPVIMAGAAHAQSSTTPQDLGVSITITDECSVGTIVPVAFGSTGAISADITADGSVDVTCTVDTDYEIALDAGDGATASIADREMTGPGGATITYSLYSDETFDTVWGDTLEDNTVTSTGTGSAQTHTIYGRVPTQATPAPGAYTDTVSVVVHY